MIRAAIRSARGIAEWRQSNFNRWSIFPCSEAVGRIRQQGVESTHSRVGTARQTRGGQNRALALPEYLPQSGHPWSGVSLRRRFWRCRIVGPTNLETDNACIAHCNSRLCGELDHFLFHVHVVRLQIFPKVLVSSVDRPRTHSKLYPDIFNRFDLACMPHGLEEMQATPRAVTIDSTG